jgi:hypothetical protein
MTLAHSPEASAFALRTTADQPADKSLIRANAVAILFAPRRARAGLLGKGARGFVLGLSSFVGGAGARLLCSGFWLLVVSFGHETSFLFEAEGPRS